MNGTLIEELNDALKLGLGAEKQWLRSDVTRGALSIMESNGQTVIKGYSVIAKGPALGHNMLVDDTTLDQVVSLGNKSKMGIKSRFDHPSASSTSMGTFIGRTKNFRKDGDRVRGDLHLSEAAKESPNGDLHKYVVALALEDPAAFGASIVFRGESEMQKDEQGQELPKQPKLARVEALMASDVVDEPAANADGLFAQEDSLAAKVSSFLTRWAAHDLMPQFVTAFNLMKEALMSEVKIELAGLTDEMRKALQAEGQKAERERIKGIWKAMLEGDKDYDAFAEMVELGASVEEAGTIYKKRRLARLTTAAPQTLGGSVEQTDKKVDLSALPLEERCKAEFESDKAVRAEFGTLPIYTSFKRAEEAGAVKIFQKK